MDIDETRAMGPLSVEPEQWSHGGRIAVVHPDRGIVAVIEPLNNEEEPDMDSAKREPWDEAYASLFAAAPEMRDELESLLSGYNRDQIIAGLVEVRLDPDSVRRILALLGRLSPAAGVQEPAHQFSR